MPLGPGQGAALRVSGQRGVKTQRVWDRDGPRLGPGKGGGERGVAVRRCPHLRSGHERHADVGAEQRAPHRAARPAVPHSPRRLQDHLPYGTGRDGTGPPSRAGSVPPVADHPPHPLPGSTGRAERPPHVALMAEDFARRAPPGPPRGPRSSARHCPGWGGAGGGAAAEPLWGPGVRWGSGCPRPIKGARCWMWCRVP